MEYDLLRFSAHIIDVKYAAQVPRVVFKSGWRMIKNAGLCRGFDDKKAVDMVAFRMESCTRKGIGSLWYKLSLKSNSVQKEHWALVRSTNHCVRSVY